MTKFILAIGGIDYQWYQELSLVGKFFALFGSLCACLVLLGVALIGAVVAMVAISGCL